MTREGVRLGNSSDLVRAVLFYVPSWNIQYVLRNDERRPSRQRREFAIAKTLVFLRANGSYKIS